MAQAQFQTREEWRQAQATLEAQKAGTAPPDTDECGNAINPHIPQYMSQAPWYLNYNFKTLKHQRKIPTKADEVDDINAWYARGQTKGPAATKYRKGACANCGAMTHGEKDCVERPRKLGAKHTGKDIMPDEVITEVNLKWDGKHDRWNGVDLDQCQLEVQERHKAVEKARAEIRQEQLMLAAAQAEGIAKEDIEEAEKTLRNIDVTRWNVLERKQVVEKRLQALKEKGDEKSLKLVEDLQAAQTTLLSLYPVEVGGLCKEEEIADMTKIDEDKQKEEVNASASDADKLASKMDMGGVRDGVEAKVTSRNLRIREDTAKYLRNLSTDPAYYYDPKTRSQRANPYPDKDPSEVDYAGDSWVRATGDATKINSMQVFCWDATKRLQDSGHQGKYINMQANPTQAERAFRANEAMKDELKELKANRLVDKYGGSEHLKSMPDELRYGQSEAFTVYRADGTVLKGEEKAVTRSKYEEDVHINGHTAVWGSYWEAGQWGYKCCQSLIHNSLCTAKKGAAAPLAIEQAKEHQKMLEEMEALEKEMLGTEAAEPEKKKRKMEKEKKSKMEEEMKKRGYHSTEGYENGNKVSKEEMEAYHRSRLHADDPMKQFLEGGGDEEN